MDLNAINAIQGSVPTVIERRGWESELAKALEKLQAPLAETNLRLVTGAVTGAVPALGKTCDG